MRFFEFEVNQLPIYDLERENLKEWAKESPHILESADDDRIKEIREFLNLHVIDPRQLTKGNKYYPISITARPLANSIKLQISDTPVIYSGIFDDNFIFKGVYEFRLPINQDVISEYGPYMITTTVYTTPDECNQFLTMVGLQFGGRWNLTQTKVSG